MQNYFNLAGQSSGEISFENLREIWKNTVATINLIEQGI